MVVWEAMHKRRIWRLRASFPDGRVAPRQG